MSKSAKPIFMPSAMPMTSKIDYSLDDQVKQTLRKFKEDKKKNLNYKQQLLLLENQYNQLSAKLNNKASDKLTISNKITEGIYTKKDTDAKANRKIKLQKEIEYLKKQINDIENNSDELEYYLNVYEFVTNYYDVNNFNIEFTQDMSANSKEQIIPKEKNILSYFKMENEQQINDDSKIKYFINVKYNNFINNIAEKKYSSKICKICNSERISNYSEGYSVCTICGEIDNLSIDAYDNMKETTQDKQVYPYKRLNHFVEWLNQFQAKETANIPIEIYDKILMEIKKNNVSDLNNITIHDIKKILKKLKLHKYYEHISYITSQITGNHPPILEHDTEEYLKQKFKEVEKSFDKHCPNNRTNFLSYSYVLHKIFQLHGNDEVLGYFPLLKSREKLRLQDRLWQQICDDLNWKFYPSL